MDRSGETADEVVNEGYPILDGGVGKLSSLGKINASFFFIKPSFFIRFMSWFEILDLSHSETSRSCVAMLASRVVCLVSLDRGGINAGAGKIGDADERKSLFGGNGSFWTERG
jgi:hypothetical protein